MFRPKTPSPREAYYRGSVGGWVFHVGGWGFHVGGWGFHVGGWGFHVALVVEGSIHHQFTPFTMVDTTPYHDWGATVFTIRRLNAHIYLFLAFPRRTRHTVKQREARLITDDTVPPVPEVSPSVRSLTHTAASQRIQSQSGTPGGTPRLITGPGEFPTQRPVMRSFDGFFYLLLNKRLSKQPLGWWFETPSWSLWRHCHAVLTPKVPVERFTSIVVFPA